MEGGGKDLSQLIERMEGREASVAAKVRELMPVIDKRLRQGDVRHEDVVAVLNEHGGFSRPLQVQHFRRLLASYRRGTGSASAGAGVAHAGGTGERGRAGGTEAAGRIISSADLRRVRAVEVDLEELAKRAKEERS